MNLTTMQETYLRNVTSASDAHKRAKRDALARAKQIAAEEVIAHEAALDLEIRIAFDAGVPKYRIGREGMNTSDSKTVENSLRRTERSRELVDTSREQSPDRFAWTGSLDDYGRPEVLVSMYGPDWDTWLAEQRRGGHLRQPALAQATTALFCVLDGGQIGTLEPDQSGGIMIDHPVVAWHKRDQMTELKSWIAANPRSTEQEVEPWAPLN